MSYINYIKAFGNIKLEQIKCELNKKKNHNLSIEQIKILEELKETGVVVIPEYYESELCDSIRLSLDNMIKDSKVKKWYDESKSDSRVFASHRYSDDILKFHDDSFLQQIGEAYTGNELVNSHTLGAKLCVKESNLGSGGGWHRDSVYQTQYKSIVYLTDVKINNGPFEYIFGSHKKSTVLNSILENNFSANQNRLNQEQINNFLKSNPSAKTKIMTAKKGTVILVDTSGIHRGIPIQEGTRYALTNYYFLKHNYTTKARAKFEEFF